MALRDALRGVCAAALLGAASWAFAQAAAPAAAGPRFEIRRFVFDGATLVSRRRLDQVTRRYRGKDRSFADVERALEAVERAYADAGYNAVRVLLPEQALDRGEVRFRIVEARIGRVRVEGNEHFSAANVRASVPSLVPGAAPNIKAIDRSLRVANQNPAKHEAVVLRSAAKPATVDAAIQVEDQPTRRASIAIDNSGTPQTGMYRLGLGYQDANVGGRDRVLTLQWVGAPNERNHPSRLSLEPSSGVLILGAGYQIPLYARGDRLDFALGYSNVSSGVIAHLFSVTGAGSIASARYTHYLGRVGDYEHSVSASLEYRAYDNSGVRVLGSNVQLIPNITVHPLTLRYAGTLRGAGSRASFSLGVSQNLPGGNDGTSTAFCGSRRGGHGECARPGYRIWGWSAEYDRGLGADWQLRLVGDGQWSRDLLVVGEQFGLGGADSVRGFRERELLDDNGYRGSVELYTPDFGAELGDVHARALAFVDWGAVRRNDPAPGEVGGRHVSSFGVGLRFRRGESISLRLDCGVVADGGGVEGAGHSRVDASLAYVF